MSLPNKVAQFDEDSDLAHSWVHGPATGAGSTITTDSGVVDTPAKLIADVSQELQVFVDLTSDWANGNATNTTVLGGAAIASPAKLIADNEAEIQAVVDLSSAWANGPATGTNSTVVMGGVAVRSPAKLIADKSAEIDLAADTLPLFAAPSGASLVGYAASLLATTRTLQNKMQDWIHVKDFGAVGDDNATDTDAFIKALATGKNVDIGGFENIYRVNAPLTLAVGQKLGGSGGRIRRVGAGHTVIFDDYSEMEGVFILSDGITPGQTGVYINNKTRTKVRGCAFVGIQGSGYQIENSIGQRDGNIISDSIFTGCLIGVDLEERGEYVTVVGCHLTNCETGIHIVGGSSNISACNITNCTNGVHITAGANDAHGRVTNCIINHATQYNVKVDSINVSDFKFDACDLYYGSIWLRYCSGVVFTGCVFDANSFYFEQALYNYFVSCHFISSPSLNHRWIGTQSLTHFVNCIFPAGSADSLSINGGYVKVRRATGLNIATSATQQLLPLDTISYNAVSGDLNHTYLMFHNLATNTFENMHLLKSPNRDFVTKISAAISIGGQIALIDFSKVKIYIRNLAGAIIGVFTQPAVVEGTTPGTHWGVYTFNGVVPVQSFQVWMVNDTGGDVRLWQDQATVPTYIEVQGF